MISIKAIIDEDISNYKECSMYIAFPSCTFKCEKECGIKMCQNSHLATAPTIQISAEDIVMRYLKNPLTHSIVISGLEPFDTFDDLLKLIDTFRKHTLDDIIIHTGYYEKELVDKLDDIKVYPNIIIKFGRFVPGHKPHFDDILGVKLASDNQYARRIS